MYLEGSNGTPVKGDTTTGALRVCTYDFRGNPVGSTPMNRASSAAFSSAASATDIAYFPGRANVGIRVYKTWISGVQTTAGLVSVFLIKRSSANSGGTATALTAVPLNSTVSAATGVPLVYTANPAGLGTAVGNLFTGKLNVPAPATATAAPPPVLMVDFMNDYGEPLTLHGTAEGLVWNLGGVTVTGGSFHVGFAWTETAE